MESMAFEHSTVLPDLRVHIAGPKIAHSTPSFSNLSFWGKGSAPKAPIFSPFLRGNFFTLCVYAQNTQNLVENSKMFEKHRKFFDP